MKMFDCCKISDVIVRRKLKFLQRYPPSDCIVCLACNEYLASRDCLCLAVYMIHCLSDFVTCVSLICVCPFLSSNILLPFNGEKRCVVKLFFGSHDVWGGGRQRSKNIFAICSTASWSSELGLCQSSTRCDDILKNLTIPFLDTPDMSVMHDATSRLQSSVLQLTKDDRMFQSEWGSDWAPQELFPGLRCIALCRL